MTARFLVLYEGCCGGVSFLPAVVMACVSRRA